MKNLKRSAFGLSFLIALLCLQGCERQPTKEQGELRHKLFVECMELAAKNGRFKDLDAAVARAADLRKQLHAEFSNGGVS